MSDETNELNPNGNEENTAGTNTSGKDNFDDFSPENLAKVQKMIDQFVAKSGVIQNQEEEEEDSSVIGSVAGFIFWIIGGFFKVIFTMVFSLFFGIFYYILCLVIGLFVVYIILQCLV